MPQTLIHRYRGRDFGQGDLDRIREIVDHRDLYPTRSAIANAVCQQLQWTRPNGQPNLIGCSAALLRMQEDGLITLPPASHSRSSGWPRKVRLPTPPKRDWPASIQGDVRDLGSIDLVPTSGRDLGARPYRDLLAQFHYLGYVPICGAQMRYRIVTARGEVGVIGFGSAAWRVAVRDRWIGWDDTTRERNLPLIVQNVRFLILPWVRVPNLASHVLALAARRVPDDWLSRYGVHPVLLETFVDSYQFSGTSYRAANWIYLGETNGKGRNNRRTRLRRHLEEKDVYVYPLTPDCRRRLRT